MKNLQICDILKNLRSNKLGKKLSKERVSEVCDVNPSTYMRWEKGDTKIPFEAVSKLAHFYDVPISYFNGKQDNLDSHNSSTIATTNYDNLVNVMIGLKEKLDDHIALSDFSDLDREIIKNLKNASESKKRTICELLDINYEQLVEEMRRNA